MPAQVLPDLEGIELLRKTLVEEGFRTKGGYEIARDVSRQGLIFPRPTEGHEFGLRYDANGWTAIVWTSFVYATGKARKNDSIWVLIVQGDKRLYVRQMYRTENWLWRTLNYALASKTRVEFRPLCPKCHSFMDIKSGGKFDKDEPNKSMKGFGARYFVCWKRLAHDDKNVVFIGWDEPLKHLKPEIQLKLKRFLEEHRKLRAIHRDRMRTAGKEPGRAPFIRKPYKITRPENLLP